MKKETISEFEFYNKPVKYENGEIDITGIITLRWIEKLSGIKADELYHIGDTEDSEFSAEYMEALVDIFDKGATYEGETYEMLVFNEGDPGVVEPGDTHIMVLATEIGMVVKVWSESPHGEYASYFGDYDAWLNCEKGIIEENEVEYPEVTLTVSSDTIKKLIEHWETDIEDVTESLQSDIDEMILKRTGIIN